MPLTRQPIHQLSTQLANQIAAGEVVERPSSVIKELLENSLDASATKIDIDINGGGTQQIRIRDNGFGIPQNELELALTPHATSKIRNLDDLINVMSMGFRGEALASIASVSELVLTSHHEEMAWSIKVKENGFNLSPASHPQGTTVEVNNLFYNTPARRKFLKADRTEYKHVEDVVKRLALSHFDVAFNFKHNGRQIFSLPAALSDENKLQRITRLINKEFVQAAVALNFENAGLKLSGWVANAEYSRSQSDMQYFFVNGRMVRDKVITHAVRQAFQDSLYPGRFPVYVLQLEMDAEQVDVNVHPTKHEVRFRQSRLVHDFLFYSLRQSLAEEKHGVDGNVIQHNNMPSHSFNHSNNYNGFNSKQYSSVGETTNVYASSAHQTLLNSDELNKPLGLAIAKLKNNYLLMQNQQGLLVLQLQQARRCLFNEQIKTALVEHEKLISKPVLIPFTISLKNNAQSFLQKYSDELQLMGFEFTLLGENELMLRQVPAMLNAIDIKESAKQFINKVESDTVAFPQALVDILINNDFANSPSDWNNLLRELEKMDDDEVKKLYHEVTDKDLAGLFKK